MKLLPKPFHALVIGSSGTVGRAFVELLKNTPSCSGVTGIHRHSEFPLDYQSLESIESCADALVPEAPFQLIINTSIEWARTKPNTALIAMHPGTVNSRLSKPFRGEQIGRPAIDAVTDMFRVIENLKKEDSGSFISYSGEKLPW